MKGPAPRLDLLVDVGRYRRRCCRSGRTCARTGIGDGRRDAVERSAQLILLLYLDKRGRPGTRSRQTKVGPEEKIPPLGCGAQHERSAPAEAKPINWARAVGFRRRRETLYLTPRPHFTAPSCTLGDQMRASDGPPFRQERRPTGVGRLPEPVAVCSPKQALCELGDRVLGRRPHG